MDVSSAPTGIPIITPQAAAASSTEDRGGRLSDSEAIANDEDRNAEDALKDVVEISPNKRYIRFEVILSQANSSRIQSSYKAFDTRNGIEVAWHVINTQNLREAEQTRLTQCVNSVKDIQSKHVTEFLTCWFDKTSRSLNIITCVYSTLKEFITEKVITMRWRIVKKWCKQILLGLADLHSHSPPIVHGKISCSHIYIDSGLGTTNIGDLWLAMVLDGDVSNMNNVIESAWHDFSGCSAPEIFTKKSITTKVYVYMKFRYL